MTKSKIINLPKGLRLAASDEIGWYYLTGLESPRSVWVTDAPDPLSFAPGATLTEDADAPARFSVWLDDDLIGSGDCSSDAIDDARATVSGWTTSAH